MYYHYKALVTFPQPLKIPFSAFVHILVKKLNIDDRTWPLGWPGDILMTFEQL